MMLPICLIDINISKQGKTMELPNLQTNTFSIDFRQWTTLRAILTTFPEGTLDAKFLQKQDKQLNRYVFVFDMCYEHQKWKLRRRFTDLLNFQRNITQKYGKELPVFPIQKQHDLTNSNITQFGQFLSIFLKRVVNIAFYDEEVQHFFDILPEKFGHGIIYVETELKKQSGGRYNEPSCSKSMRNILFPCTRSWRSRFFTVTDNGVFYSLKKKSYEIRDMFLFCNRFKVLCGNLQTDHELGIVLKTATRQITLEAYSLDDFVLFVNAIFQGLRNCPYSQEQRFDSFAPIRQNCQTKFYVDGQDYFSDMCVELLAAKKYVFITGWMITPYFLLKRPSQLDDKHSRFDYILEQVATRGVKVYIILYQQPQIAINNDSAFLNPNIRVIRHPTYLVIPFLWSHHEKSVLVDQRVAFIGGLDICYGRWDNAKHSLVNDKNYWKGADFCNLRISDIYSPRNFLMSNLDDRTEPRMPWHDVAVQIKGSSVHDLARHFTSYWNFVSFQTKFDDRQLLNLAGRQTSSNRSSSPIKNNHKVVPILDKRKYTDENELVDHQIEDEYYKKYLDSTVVKFMSLELPTIQTMKESIKRYPKKIIGLLRGNEEEEKLITANQDEVETCPSSIPTHTHQFVRSACSWSQGLLQKQQSIHAAYLNLIQTSEHFIYIENQFFICKENLVAEKLAERISKAHREKKPFKVIIMIPLLPGFEGDVREDNSVVMRVQLYWEYWTISRSSHSLYRKLKHIANIDDYVKFYSLRQHGSTKDDLPLTEILYIHSKLMIVDDKRLIIGSANINDRSLVGDRDSELAIVIENQNGKPGSFSAEIQKFRVDLFVEHFQISRQQAICFTSDRIWNLMKKRAQLNTLIYRKVFGCYPDDTMVKFEDIKRVQEESRLQEYKQYREKIVGHVVELPLHFLEKEDLNLSAKQKEFFLPLIFFT